MLEAMLFSTQNIHLEKSLHYLISFSFHTSLTKSHLPIHIQKLMQWVHLHSHNHLHYKLGLLFQKALKDPEHVEIVRKFKDEVRNVIGIGEL